MSCGMDEMLAAETLTIYIRRGRNWKMHDPVRILEDIFSGGLNEYKSN